MLKPLIRQPLFSLILFSLVWNYFSPTDVRANDLPKIIKATLNKYNLPDSSISIYIENTQSKEPIVNWRSTELVNPASTMKLITTYAGLDLLGSDFTWDTEFLIDSPIVKQSIHGDIFIKGSGDPLFINETLEQAIIEIQQSGLKNIAGDLIIDNSYFNLATSNKRSLDGKSISPYNAQPDAANINFGTVEFSIITGKYSSRPNIVMNPSLPGYKIFSRLRMKGGKCHSSYREPKIEFVPYQGVTTISFSGKYAKRCGNQRFYHVIDGPDILLYGVFKRLWQKHGGKFTGGYKYGIIPENATLIHTLVSQPLKDQIAIMNKKSNNVMTRQLFLTIGAQILGKPGTLEKSRQVINKWAMKKGFDLSEGFIDNGSGLSRESVISTKQLSDLLTNAAHHPDSDNFIDSLSIAGVDGTMRNRFRNHPAQGEILMKTGTLNGIRAIAGFVNSQSGNQYTVASIQQHHAIGNGRGKSIQNKILNWLYEQ